MREMPWESTPRRLVRTSSSAASAAWAKKTQPPEESKLAESILPSQPDPGKVVSREHDKDLDLTTVTFATGVVMRHKFVDYKKDQVSVQINLPGGAIEETPENKGVSEVASLMVGRPATSRFTSSQIRDLMTGKNVGVVGGIGLDTLAFSVGGSPKDLSLGMELVHAVLTDGTLEQSALDDWKTQELQNLERRKTSAQARLRDAMTKTVYGNDVRNEPGLVLPRPDLIKRAYMLKPAVDLAPDLVHPTLHRTLRELWEAFEGRDHAMSVVEIR